MIINGLSPGIPVQEQKLSNLEEEKLTEQIALQNEEVRKEEVHKEEVKEKAEEKNSDSSKFVMNDYHLKELLFMISSRGNSATIEKLAQLLKREKEMISRK